MNNLELFEYSFTVGSCDMDLWGVIKPSVILNLCQECAYMHSTASGFGYNKLHELGLTWVLSRVEAQIERLPKWGEQITVSTWHKRQAGIFSLRDYIFVDAEQKPIIRVTTSWLIINMATRRITRADHIFSDEAFGVVTFDKDALTAEAQKVTLPAEVTAVGEHHVAYSDIDVNQHVNNVRYLELACDHSPQQMEREPKLKSFAINFNHEAKFGECISLCAAPYNSEKVSVGGDVEGRNIFTAELIYQP